MLTKAGLVTAAAASLMMLGAPAFAAPAGPPAATTNAGADGQSAAGSGVDQHSVSQNGLINISGTQILDNINICDITLGLVAVDVNGSTVCVVSDLQNNQQVESSNTEDGQ